MNIFMLIVQIVAVLAFCCLTVFLSIWMIHERQRMKYAMQFGRGGYMDYVDPDEMVNRELELLRKENGGLPVNKRTFTRHGKYKAVKVVETDNRGNWRIQAHMHEEQCNNWIALIKNDLNQ